MSDYEEFPIFESTPTPIPLQNVTSLDEIDTAAVVVKQITDVSSEDVVSQNLTVIWSLMVVVFICAFFLQRYRVHILPPASAALILGMVFGGFYRLVSSTRGGLRFSPAIFFYGLLPPIVFSAGFNLKKRHFFRNFGSIMLFAVVGTIISTLIFALATYFFMLIGLVHRSSLGDSAMVVSLLYGALISSIDPVATLAVFADIEVPTLLYHLVFGESVMNDAVAIVLFKTFEEFYTVPVTFGTIPYMAWRFLYIFFGSMALGIALSLPAAFVLKRFQLASMSGGPSFDGSIYEIAILFMGAYLTYILSEACGFSGIASLFVGGIIHAHYSFYNIIEESQITVKKSLETWAFLAETALFAYLGLQVSTFDHVVDWGLLITGIPLCLLSRAANIFPLAYLSNLRREVKLPWNLQCMQWAVGLRGAVAYGLVVHLPTISQGHEREGNPAIETATLFIVCASTIVLGGGTVKLLEHFKLDSESMRSDPAQSNLLSPSNSSGADPSSWAARFKEFDREYLKPLFGGRDSSYVAREGRPSRPASSDGALSPHRQSSLPGDDEGFTPRGYAGLDMETELQ